MDKIPSLFAKFNLSTDAQNELFKVLKLLPLAELNELCDFLKIHPEWIIKLYDNYQSKKQAADKADSKLWQKILEQEEKMIKEME